MEPIHTAIGGFAMTESPVTATAPSRVTMIFHKSLNHRHPISPVPRNQHKRRSLTDHGK